MLKKVCHGGNNFILQHIIHRFTGNNKTIATFSLIALQGKSITTVRMLLKKWLLIE